MKLVKILLFAFLFTTVAYGQLSNFTVQVIKTDETCLGNGTITISALNTTPGASLLYKVYKLPNTTEAVSITTTGVVNSLTSGTYKVVAVQALGNQSNVQEQNVVINNNIAPLNFTISASNQNCASGGNLNVNVTSGTAAGYEIIAGPQNRPLQTSNIFTGLASGTYKVRVYDVCGVAKVKTFTLSITETVLNISNASYSDMNPTLCDSIMVNNLITPSSGNISYPVAVKYTLNPLTISGEPVIINKVYATGDSDSLVVSAVMPRFLTDSYTYEMRVTDNCNTVYQKMDNVVDPSIGLALTKGHLSCANRYLKVAVSKHMAPYTIEFLNVPEGFTAGNFNPAANGPFTEDNIEFGGEGNPIPFGTYVVKVTDACGRTTEESIDILFEPLEPVLKGINNGCFSEFGKIRVSVPEQKVVTATILAAPSTYNQPLPKNVTASINSQGMLVLSNMPLGVYTITFTDDCGFSYTVDVEVPPFVEKDFSVATLPDCAAGFGSATMKSGNGDLTSVLITSAPASFGQALPFDASVNINDGTFYMAGLPAGDYTFTATDYCGIVKSKSIKVEGYVPPVNPYVFTPNCGSFSVKVTDNSNGDEEASYWLQKFNPATGNWGHPNTGTVYNEGAVPTTTNSIKLSNNTTRNNLNYVGQFRIVKKFETYSTDSADKTKCISVLGTFNFTDAFAISNAYTMGCTGHPNDVYVEAVGYIVSYKVEKKNGNSFVIENGANNIFTNLEPAIYLFSIEDVCGNKLTKEFNLAELPSLADATKPADMNICADETTTGSHIFHLTDQNAAILGNLPAAMYTITYHVSQEDADNGVNMLPENYTSMGNGETVYVRLVNNYISICHGTTSFALYAGERPQPRIITEGTICNDGKLALTADAAYSSYLWSTGETTRTIYVTEPGTYTLIVEKQYGNRICDNVTDITVQGSSAPSIVKVDTKDWSRSENTITVYAEGKGKYEYSIDGEHFQESNVFTNLETGFYHVYVKDANGCGMDVKDVVLMHYMNFFTPNGDGFRDKWRIEYSTYEPHLKVDIFDRYGKHLASFGPTSEGWDGTLNGIQLPSTDYWFVVTREDGRELKGHFAMLR